jgi:hypothetical protein
MVQTIPAGHAGWNTSVDNRHSGETHPANSGVASWSKATLILSAVSKVPIKETAYSAIKIGKKATDAASKSTPRNRSHQLMWRPPKNLDIITKGLLKSQTGWGDGRPARGRGGVRTSLAAIAVSPRGLHRRPTSRAPPHPNYLHIVEQRAAARERVRSQGFGKNPPRILQVVRHNLPARARPARCHQQIEAQLLPG